MFITNDIKYVGVNDHEIDLFEGQFTVPNGMAYNSYVITDEKTAVMDTVDARFTAEWLDNIESVLGGRKPDYLVVQHMEPDHSANIVNFLTAYPEATVIANSKTLTMMKNFFDYDFDGKVQLVEDGSSISLGRHELTFVFAPMVHWPEVMFTYDKADKVLFTADGFGKFGAQVQSVLKKAAALDINIICPLHGPVLSEDLGHYIEKYDIWSSYKPESEGVMIAYTSVYGNTKKAAERLADMLRAKGCPKVVVTDLAREDIAEAIEDAFRYGKLVLATTTYNSDIFPFMKHFIDGLTERGYRNRTIGLIENGSWAPVAAKVMRDKFAPSKNITILETTVRIKSALNAESEAQLAQLADELLAD